MLNYSKTAMEELDVTSAWILNNFITVSTVTMNMKWTCPEKTINLPPSQAIAVFFSTALYCKNEAWKRPDFLRPSLPFSCGVVLLFVEWSLVWAPLRSSHGQWRGGGFGVPLWFGKGSCQDWLNTTHTHTRTHTPTQNWKSSSSGSSKQTVSSY